jgi:hypothetical protein
MWLEQHCHFEPRPLESISGKTQEAKTRELIGHSSFDSVAIAIHRENAMYADDLGLRGLLAASHEDSFSTVALLIGMAESGEITREDADTRLVRLLQRRYFVVPMSSALLQAIVTQMTGSELVSAIAHMAPPAFSLERAARLSAEAVRSVATTLSLANIASGQKSFGCGSIA